MNTDDAADADDCDVILLIKSKKIWTQSSTMKMMSMFSGLTRLRLPTQPKAARSTSATAW